MLSPNSILQNRYLIVRKLGQGGMGTVYEAVDQRLSCLVALKETIVETPEMRRAFEREASLLANLRHPLLPKVIDHFMEADGQFLVMEFIHGNDLAELLSLRARSFSPEEVLGWADILLQALDYLHSRQPPIIHRDIKPGNLKVNRSGEIFLIDFGLAKGAAGQMNTLDSSRSVMGYTPIYAPLEQINGSGTDPRSDLYALAATLFHLITGQPPSDSLSRATAVMNGEADPLPPANQINPLISREVAEVLRQAMSQNRNQRPASATIMRNALQEAMTAQQEIESGEKRPFLFPQPTVPSPSGANVDSGDEAQSAHRSKEPSVSNRDSQPETQDARPEGRAGDIPVPTLSARQMFSPLRDTPVERKTGRSLPMSWIIVGAVVAVLIIGVMGVALLKSGSTNQPSTAAPSPTPAATPTPVPQSTENANISNSNANVTVPNSNKAENGNNANGANASAQGSPTPRPSPVKKPKPKRRVNREYN